MSKQSQAKRLMKKRQALTKAHQRQQQKRGGAGSSALAERVKQLLGDKFAGIQATAPEQRKLSAALLELIEPYRHEATTRDSFHRLVMVGLVAWNMSLTPAEEHEASYALFMQGQPADVAADFRAIIKMLMTRKQALFPHDDRLMVDFEITDLGNNWDVTVAGTMRAPENQPSQ